MVLVTRTYLQTHRALFQNAAMLGAGCHICSPAAFDPRRSARAKTLWRASKRSNPASTTLAPRLKNTCLNLPLSDPIWQRPRFCVDTPIHAGLKPCRRPKNWFPKGEHSCHRAGRGGVCVMQPLMRVVTFRPFAARLLTYTGAGDAF